jgi:hypothetical protein
LGGEEREEHSSSVLRGRRPERLLTTQSHLCPPPRILCHPEAAAQRGARGAARPQRHAGRKASCNQRRFRARPSCRHFSAPYNPAAETRTALARGRAAPRAPPPRRAAAPGRCQPLFTPPRSTPQAAAALASMHPPTPLQRGAPPRRRRAQGACFPALPHPRFPTSWPCIASSAAPPQPSALPRRAGPTLRTPPAALPGPGPPTAQPKPCGHGAHRQRQRPPCMRCAPAAAAAHARRRPPGAPPERLPRAAAAAARRAPRHPAAADPLAPGGQRLCACYVMRYFIRARPRAGPPPLSGGAAPRRAGRPAPPHHPLHLRAPWPHHHLVTAPPAPDPDPAAPHHATPCRATPHRTQPHIARRRTVLSGASPQPTLMSQTLPRDCWETWRLLRPCNRTMDFANHVCRQQSNALHGPARRVGAEGAEGRGARAVGGRGSQTALHW